MFWNIRWQHPERRNYMYVGLRGMLSVGFVLNDPAWLKTHSGTTRYGAKFFTSQERRQLFDVWGDLPEGFVWVCGSMRYKNALEVDKGAVNIQAISNAINSAAKEIGDHQYGTASEDPAIMLMAHQLAHLCQVAQTMDMSRYEAARSICMDMCNEGRVEY